MQSKGRAILDLPNPFGGRIYFLSETGSTMEDGRRAIDSGEPSGTVIVADYQSSGRGRGAGRSWSAEPGSSLMMTLVLSDDRIAEPKESLPLRVALGLLTYFEEIGVSGLSVKWPNDLLVHERKISGILCHRVQSWFLLGIGINVNQRRFPPDLRQPATSVALETRRTDSVDPRALLPSLLPHLQVALKTSRWREPLERRLYRIGESIALRHPPGDKRPSRRGTLMGLGESGSLKVQLKETGEVEQVFASDRVVWPGD